ncbi:MAG TPA: vWA domain-containing protein [Thermoanaerobaculia bacterium]|nr:vWA domain-containing protein [Thermoanaerobaculia bacterium]
MKRRFSLLPAVLSLVMAAPLIADEAWLLDIPVRGNAQQETGEVRMFLDLSAAPSGSQIVINGSTTLALGQTAAVGGDSATYELVSGNTVRVVYKPLSNFSGDFCQGAAAVEKQVPIRFVGAQDVVAYRVSTYVVAAPNAECSQVSKHTGDTPATITPQADGVAPALNAIYKGRNDFDVVLVLDKSGSMADNPPGSAVPPSKADILKSAVQGFVSQWEQVDAQCSGCTSDYSPDRLGLVFFDSTAAAQTLPGADPPANFFLQRGGSNAWDAVINQANTLTPGSSTSIGAGINSAMQQWKNDPRNDLSLVVITDGMQNTAPLIAPTASGFLGLTPVAGFDQELRKRFVPIQTIAFGQPAQIDEDLLRNISLETSGNSYLSVNAITLFTTFGQTLVALLKGNTVSLAENREKTYTGQVPAAPVPVVIDRSAQRVVYSVQWAPPLVNALDLDVYAPGSSTPATPTSTKKHGQISIQSFDMVNRPIGNWSVAVKRGAKGAEAVPYSLNVFVSERHLDYQFTLSNLHAAAGDALGIRVVIDWDGKPLTGLPDGAISVRIQAPPEGLGTLLFQTKRPVPTGMTITPAGDILTPVDAKLASFRGMSLLERITPRDVITIPLKEVGNGVYAATFSDTKVPGTYAFNAVLDWSNERNGHVHREERLEENLKVKPDPIRSLIDLTSPSAGTFIAKVTPRDAFDNYLGPGYGSRVRAIVRGGKLRTEVAQDLDQIGTYSVTIVEVPPGTKPQVEWIVDGVVLGNRIPTTDFHK